MKFQTITIPMTDETNKYSLKKNIKSISCIGISKVVGRSYDCVLIVINDNLKYYSKLGNIIYFNESGLYVEDIYIYVIFEDFKDKCEATLIFEEVKN